MLSTYIRKHAFTPILLNTAAAVHAPAFIFFLTILSNVPYLSCCWFWCCYGCLQPRNVASHVVSNFIMHTALIFYSVWHSVNLSFSVSSLFSEPREGQSTLIRILSRRCTENIPTTASFCSARFFVFRKTYKQNALVMATKRCNSGVRSVLPSQCQSPRHAELYLNYSLGQVRRTAHSPWLVPSASALKRDA